MAGNQSSVRKFYDGVADNYHTQYDSQRLTDLTTKYPANYFRLQLLIKSFIKNDIKNIIEVGVGEGTPLLTLSKAGMDVSGFDISTKMVEKCKSTLEGSNIDSSKIIWADIQDPVTYAELLKDGQYDALLAMGVMPHVRNDEFVLNNMKEMVKPGGKVFIEFRNKLFSLFTFNRMTYEFIMDDLLSSVSPKVKDIIKGDLTKRLEMSKPAERLVEKSGDGEETLGYDAILSKFHNPFEVIELFNKCDFSDVNLLWYHYHPAMPFLSEKDEELFRHEALKLEHETSGWKGLFLCSAFVVEATVPEDSEFSELGY